MKKNIVSNVTEDMLTYYRLLHYGYFLSQLYHLFFLCARVQPVVSL